MDIIALLTLIFSGISVIGTIVVGIFVAITNIKISKISNIKDYKEYEKNITYFELRYKDEKWLYELLQKDEFRLYSSRSQKRIYKWWEKYQNKHLAVLLKPEVDFKRSEILLSMKLGPDDLKNKNNESDGSTD
jgi:hypothetical protein